MPFDFIDVVLLVKHSHVGALQMGDLFEKLRQEGKLMRPTKLKQTISWSMRVWAMINIIRVIFQKMQIKCYAVQRPCLGSHLLNPLGLSAI